MCSAKRVTHLRLRCLFLIVEGIAFSKCPVAIVLDPVVLVVPGIRRQVQEAQIRLEWMVELAPAYLNTSTVDHAQALRQRLPAILTSAK